MFLRPLLLLTVFVSAFSISQAQIITTVAGTGTAGFSGEGTPATAASMNNPAGVAVDGSGNVYFDDQSNSRVRKIDRYGIISTIAGTGVNGFSGEGTAATAAKLYFPGGLAADGAGNVYIADDYNYRIRKVSPSGTIRTICGTGLPGFSGDGGPATLAQINHTGGIAVDGIGNVYVADMINQRVRMIDTSGVIHTIAGNGTAGFLGDSGPATLAELNIPHDVKTDAAGNVYIFDINNYRVRKIDNAGIIQTMAGIGLFGFTGDGGDATAARLNGPNGGFVDATGNVYIADMANHRIRVVDLAGIINTVAGDGSPAFGGDGGPATAAALHDPNYLATDCGGNVYFSDNANQRIRKITFDHAPVFTRGHSLNIRSCTSTSLALDSILTADDPDPGQVLTWSVESAPVHGSLIASYVVTSTGDSMIPSGLTFSGAPGYSGIDSFRVMVTDCGYLADTMMVYVTIDTGPAIGAISGPGQVCPGDSITLTDSIAGGSWALTSTVFASILPSGTVMGSANGLDTAVYTTTNGSCRASALFSFWVGGLCGPDGITHTVQNLWQLSVYPNPANGNCTISLPEKMGPVTISLRDMAGNKVGESHIVGYRSADIHLDAPPGVYMLSVSTVAGTQTARVILR